MHGKLTAVYNGPRMTMGCPHCATVLKIRSSRQIGGIVRQLVMACQNDDCCATFGADLTLTHVISAGAKPNPAVEMRATAPRRRPANDDSPPIEKMQGRSLIADNDPEADAADPSPSENHQL